MEIEVSPATPPREWSPSLEDPHTMGEYGFLKGTVSRDELNNLDKNLLIELGLTKGRGWFLNFLGLR
jgi:hypothetical protein